MANQTGILRIGTGAGFSSDRLDPAIQLVAQGSLDVIVFECLGERTLAFAHRDMQSPMEWVTTHTRKADEALTSLM
ncbi:MAG: hypothetical protein CM1200mP41_11900 [Gammaproteobacteria bacterium]|nr:MAG: hypothetical protein CM1200mP41_11900 [Gammaproteobacteria bacterium]